MECNGMNGMQWNESFCIIYKNNTKHTTERTIYI